MTHPWTLKGFPLWYGRFVRVRWTLDSKFTMMMINEADSEQVLDVEEGGMQESSDDEGREGDEGAAPGTSDQQENDIDDSVHCFTGHTGNFDS